MKHQAPFHHRPLPFACLLFMLLLGFGPAARAQAGDTASGDSIRWIEFGSEALERAGTAEKPVLLFIEAPWGHWDRLMSETVFTDPRVVSVVNEKFIPVRTDALLRPDIDLRYGLGGWPTLTFLLPTGDPLYIKDPAGKLLRAGGNFYPPADLVAYLEGMAEYFSQNRQAAAETAAEIARNVLTRSEVAEAPLTTEILEVAVTKLIAAYGEWRPDPAIKEARHPDADSMELGLEYYGRTGNRKILDIVLRQMTDMARGGIRDHLGGGFHRSATDAAWRVPAFEKLLSLNSEMLQAYNDVWLATGNPRYRTIAEEIAGYALSTLRSPEGWFYAYQASDSSLGGDGDYYTWTVEEVASVLSEEERRLVLPAFDIEAWGELTQTAPRRNVLHVSEGPYLLSQRLGMSQDEAERILESARRKMLEARNARQAPPVGKVLVTASAASMTSSILQAADAWDRQDLRDAGIQSLGEIWRRNFVAQPGLMDRAWSPGGGNTGTPDLFDDQVQMVRALAAAYESTGDPEHLERAYALAESASKSFADTLNGGWSDRIFSAEAPGLLAWPTRSIRANALFADALLRLHYLGAAGGSGEKMLGKARKALESWADEYTRFEQAGSAFAIAATHALHPPLEVIIVGKQTDEGYRKVRSDSLSLYHPWKVVTYAATERERSRLAERGVELPEGASTVLCVGGRCSKPFPPGTKLWGAMREFLGGTDGSSAGTGGEEEGR